MRGRDSVLVLEPAETKQEGGSSSSADQQPLDHLQEDLPLLLHHFIVISKLEYFNVRFLSACLA